MSTICSAFWLRDPCTISGDEYLECYRSLSPQNNEYLMMKHFCIEGQLEFSSIFFIPKICNTFKFESYKYASQDTKDLISGYIKQSQALNIPPLISLLISSYFNNNDPERGRVQLYLFHQLYNNDCRELLPDYLFFIYGAVNSEDLTDSLIKYHKIQSNKIFKIIRKNNTKKIISAITDMSMNDKDKYKLFYNDYQKYIKMAIHSDARNRKRLAELLRFCTSKTKNEEVSLCEYVERMKNDQRHIYYAYNHGDINQNEMMMLFNERDLEVLYLKHSDDENMMNVLREYDGKKLMNLLNVTMNELPLTKQEETDRNKQILLCNPLCDKIKNVLGDKIDNVTVCDARSIYKDEVYAFDPNSGWSCWRILQCQAERDNN